MTTPIGRAMAGLLAVFAEFERDILRERVKAGIAQARAEGRPHGRPGTAALQEVRVREMHEAGISKSEIARRLSIGRTSVRRMLQQGVATEHNGGRRRCAFRHEFRPEPRPWGPKTGEMRLGNS